MTGSDPLLCDREKTSEQHLSCPKCGYDLYGLPAIRCPECGFRYDTAALRALAVETDWIRLAVAQDVTKWAASAAFLSLPGAMAQLGLDLVARLVILIVVSTLAFFAWAWVTGIGELFAWRPLGLRLCSFCFHSSPDHLPIGTRTGCSRSTDFCASWQ
jgi:ribosomal protein L37E